MSDYEKYLFRGKRKDNGEWIYGYYCVFNGMIHCIYTGYAETDCGDIYPDYYEVDPDTVGQYTGLPDKNSTKIFEGDIVKSNRFNKIEEVRYTNKRKRIMFCGINYVTDLEYINENDYEVIGNIHDNPELLGSYY